MAVDSIVALSIGVTVPFVLACPVSFALRMYSRIRIAKSFGADDWMMVAAFVFWIGQQAIIYSWVRYGAGRHISEVSSEDYLMLRTYLFAEEFYYLWEQLLIKLSFLLFYLRFLNLTKFRYAIYAVMTIVVLQVAGTWVFYGLQCRPIGAYLHPELYPNAKCLTSGLSYYAPTAVNVGVDIIIYALPIYPLWNLQTSVRKRLGLIVVMTLGGCTVLVSGLRIIVLWQLATQPDFTYIFGRVVIVTTIEFVTAIVTANMPAMKTIWTYHVAKDLHTFKVDHELRPYSRSDGYLKGTQGKSYTRAEGPGITVDGAASQHSSPAESQEELVRGKQTSVVVTSEWRVRSETRTELNRL